VCRCQSCGWLGWRAWSECQTWQPLRAAFCGARMRQCGAHCYSFGPLQRLPGSPRVPSGPDGSAPVPPRAPPPMHLLRRTLPAADASSSAQTQTFEGCPDPLFLPLQPQAPSSLSAPPPARLRSCRACRAWMIVMIGAPARLQMGKLSWYTKCASCVGFSELAAADLWQPVLADIRRLSAGRSWRGRTKTLIPRRWCSPTRLVCKCILERPWAC
jgi:hypothetical protein